MRRNLVLAPLALCVALAAACGGGGDSSSITSPSTGSASTAATPAVITVVTGDAQSAIVGTTLATPIAVKVTTASGAPVAGVTVTFVASAGAASIVPSTAITDATGTATARLTLGSGSGTVTITATVQGTGISTTLTETATAPAANIACTPGTATTMTPGQAVIINAGSLCVPGGVTGAEYALVPFNTSTNANTLASVTVQTAGIDPVSSTTLGTYGASSSASSGTPTSAGIAASRGIARGISRGAAGGISPALLAPPMVASDYEARLHARRAQELSSFVEGAREWYAARNAPGMRRAVIPAGAQVGQLYRLNGNGTDPCVNIDMRTARVMAVSSKAIVVADTLNPTGGYTQADYQSIAVTFDTLIDAVDTRNFGQPTDIDNNGHVILFFTSAVNALTPRNSGEYIGGFFDSRDLFPTTTTNGLPGCAGSNTGEMFYLLVPDPSGMVNGNRFSKNFVTAVTLSTVAHEYQHLINASRRLYVNNASDFEDTWLDEGLAHVAEELFFYARAHLGPRQNLDPTALKASAFTSTVFSDDAVANFDRLELYLRNPSRNSPYADNDSLATRGATWSFLRWAADQQIVPEPTVWQRLVNSKTTGLANLQSVFGGDVTPLFRDWATTLLLDDVPGATSRYQFPSWNLRAMYGALLGDGTYPLSTVALANGAARTVVVAGGSAAYLRFAVGAGNSGSISWNALPTPVTLTLVRLR